MSVLDYIKRIVPMKQIDVGDVERRDASEKDITIFVGNQKKNGMEVREDEMDENGEYKVYEREILPDKIICPDCGGITLEGLDFCDKCGAELGMYK